MAKKSKQYTTISDDIAHVVNDNMVSYGNTAKSEVMLHQLSKTGIKKAFAQSIAQKLGLTIYEFAPLLHISSRTLLRYADNDLLDTTSSEHILLLEKLIDEGVEVFGNVQNFREWLHSKVMALDFEQPIRMLDTIFGIQMVNQMLGRIKYGVYS